VYFSFTNWNCTSADYNIIVFKKYLNIFSETGFSQASEILTAFIFRHTL